MRTREMILDEIKALEEKLSTLRQELAATETVVEPVVESTDVLFDTPENFDKRMSFINNLTQELIEDVSEIADSETPIYVKQLEQYSKYITRIQNKYDEDEYSQEVTAKFTAIIERDFLKILKSIYTGLKHGRDYNKYAQLLETYLSDLKFQLSFAHVVGTKMLDFDTVNVCKNFVNDESQVGIIHEVILPRFIAPYINEDGETSKYYTHAIIAVNVLK